MKTRRQRPAWHKLVAGVLILAALAAAWRFTPLSQLLTHERIVGWAKAVRGTPWAPVALILAYTPAAFVLFPRPLLTLFAAIAFGAWLGFAYSALGILLAALVSYYAGRFVSKERVRRMAGDAYDTTRELLKEHGVLAIFASNMVPVPPFVVQGIVAGAVRMKLWEYTAGSILGMLPGLLAATVFARPLAAMLEDPAEASWWMAAVAAIVFGLFVYLFRRWYAKHSKGKR